MPRGCWVADAVLTTDRLILRNWWGRRDPDILRTADGLKPLVADVIVHSTTKARWQDQ